jgi:HisA/HisF family protein
MIIALGNSTVEIIPVIDLKGGRVVRARMGRRDEYRPIETPLARTSGAVEVVGGLLSLYPFRRLYVADLDAIESIGDNNSTLERLRLVYPDLSLWVDNGVRDLRAARDWLAEEWGALVLGSETQKDADVVRGLADDRRVVLSLDFRGDAFQGPAELLANPDLWPQRIIAMTLARVGSGAGPDINRLGALRRAAPSRKLYAAGGVRDIADIETLAQAEIAGALVATSLHDGRLGAQDIARAQEL